MNNQLVSVTHSVRLTRWNEIFNDREDSGLTIDEYCRQNNLSKNAYYYWLRKCRENTLSECENAFVELEAPSFKEGSLTKEFHPQAIIEINGARISVSEKISQSLLSMIVEVTRNA